jgi:hypothetical protein
LLVAGYWLLVLVIVVYFVILEKSVHPTFYTTSQEPTTKNQPQKKNLPAWFRDGKAPECFHVVLQSDTKVIYPRWFMANAFKIYAVQPEKLSACQIYDVLEKTPHSQ